MVFGNYMNNSSQYFGLRCLQSGNEVALKSIVVSATVGHVIAHVQSELLYKNDTPEAIETVFKFPLDDGSAVYKMEAEIDGRTITAECQEKKQAQETYDDAVSRGMTAFLLQEDQNSSDIFVCNLGNLPSQKEVKLTIAYIVELTVEMNQSVKFMLPIILNPRYHRLQRRDATLQRGLFVPPSQFPDQIVESGKGSYSFNLSLTIQSQFNISNIETDCKELTVEIQEPDHNTAKVSFTSEECILDSDIVVYVSYNNNEQPVAIIERGSSGQDGIMKSDMLLLNFYPEIKEAKRKNGEYIFVIDRSGSMTGPNIENAVQTLMLLVKSLRPGCYFNIISFGTTHSCLFEKSVEYNRENSVKAVKHISRITADMGGTELLRPLNKIFGDPLVHQHPRQVFVLTDGAISNVNETLELVKRNSKTARLFSVGIGQGASTALVKGLARAGRGRYEFVYGEDRLQQKVMALMKFSLQPEIKNLSLEWLLSPGVTAVTIPQHLPTIFVGELVTLYAIISGAERHEIVCGTVKLTGDIDGQSFEYQLEFEGRGKSDDTTAAAPIHRLAAKALVKDLEIEEMATDGNDKKHDIVLASVAANIISKYTAFVGMDKESKVPIKQSNSGSLINSNNLFGGPVSLFNCSAPSSGFSFGGPVGQGFPQQSSSLFGSASFGSQSQLFQTAKLSKPMFGSSQPASFSSGGAALFDGSSLPFRSSGTANEQSSGVFGASKSDRGFDSVQSHSGLFGSKPSGFGSAQQAGVFGSNQPNSGFGFKPPQLPGGFGSPQSMGGFGSQPTAAFGSAQLSGGFGKPQDSAAHVFCFKGSASENAPLSKINSPETTGDNILKHDRVNDLKAFLTGSTGGRNGFGGAFGGQSKGSEQSVIVGDAMIGIISLQDFDGSWPMSEQLINLLKIPENITTPPEGIDSVCWITCLILVWLEKNFSNRKDEWDLIYNKALEWMLSILGEKPLNDLKALAVSKINGL